MRLGLVFVFLFLMIACGERLPEKQGYPILETLPISEIDESGATLRMKLIHKGQYPLSETGFIWNFSDPAVDGGYKIIIGSNLEKGEFEERIDINLFKSSVYYVRSFSTMGNLMVYGNLITFESIQNSSKSWSFEKSLELLEGSEGPFVASDDSLAYFLFPSNEFYSFDSKSLEFIRLNDLLFVDSTPIYATPVMMNGVPYFALWGYRDVLKYENNFWKLESQVPENYGPFRWNEYGFSHNGLLYFIGNESFKYDPQSATWVYLWPSIISEITVYKTIGDLVYTMSRGGSIDVLDVTTETMSGLANCPEAFINATRFSIGNKIYFGLDKNLNAPLNEEWFSQELWSYDIVTEEWKPEQPFPEKIPRGDVFYFVNGDKLIFCHTDQKLRVWSFTPK